MSTLYQIQLNYAYRSIQNQFHIKIDSMGTLCPFAKSYIPVVMV